MPTTYISAAPGRQMPRIATIEPRAPCSFSPTRIAIFVAFRPGRLWLMESISTNSLSLTQCRLVTRLPRRYGTTPPKLVAPIIRNSRKIWPIDTPACAIAVSASRCKASFGPLSLMALGLVPLKTVDRARLGHAEHKPILYVLLQGNVELGGQSLLLFGYVLFAIELYLEGELSHQRLMLATGAPQPDVALGNYTFSEVQLTQRQEHLLHDAFVHQGYFLIIGLLDGGKRRKHFHQSGHRGSVCLVHLTQSELAVVRVEDTMSADLVLQGKGLSLELNAVLPGNLGPHVHGHRFLLIWVTELEDDFRITHRKAIHVGNAPAQDERFVVQPKVGSVAENDLPDLWSQSSLTVFYETNTEILRRTLHDLPEVAEAFDGREAIGFKNELGFQVLDTIEWISVSVGGRGSLGPIGWLSLFAPLFIFIFVSAFFFFFVFSHGLSPKVSGVDWLRCQHEWSAQSPPRCRRQTHGGRLNKYSHRPWGGFVEHAFCTRK